MPTHDDLARPRSIRIAPVMGSLSVALMFFTLASCAGETTSPAPSTA